MAVHLKAALAALKSSRALIPLAIAGAFLALAAFAWWQTTRLDAAQREQGRQAATIDQLAAQVGECALANAAQVDQLNTLRQQITDMTREREQQARALDEANRRAAERVARAQEQARRDAAEIDAILAGDCEAWARLPVCPDVARWLREHGADGRDANEAD